tara:strand:+ start:346 stop:1632 length:1287 start_codon:yes stop_codon:yes gene_type:complete
MIINLFLKNKIEYKNIEDYSNIGLITASLITLSNVYYFKQHFLNNLFLTIYMIVDIFLTPIEKKEMIIHHTVSFSFLIFSLIFINMEINVFSVDQILITEWSSIFLGLNYFIKKYKLNKNIYTICNLIFLYTFLKYRIFDFYKNVIINSYFRESVLPDNSEYYNVLIIPFNMTKYGLFYLNLYWLSIISKSLYKMFKFNVSLLTSEYLLQYSYFLCLAMTIFTYGYYATEKQKFYYSDYIAIDVTMNLLLSMTSNKFHEYIYNSLLIDENMNKSENNFKNFLVQDILVIQLRAIAQFYVGLKMHDKFDEYEYMFYLQFIYAITLPIVTNLLYSYLIRNNIQFRIKDQNNIARFLDIFLGSNPALCISYSIIGILNTNNATNLFIILYLVILITIVKPFYNLNHFMVHIGFIFINYQLAINNLHNLKVV